jgi:dienelactone hydrolase
MKIIYKIFLLVFLFLHVVIPQSFDLNVFDSIKTSSPGVWSSDSKSILYSSGGKLWRYSLPDESISESSDSTGYSGQIIPALNNTKIMLRKNEQIAVINTYTGKIEKLFDVRPNYYWIPAPSGDSIIFIEEDKLWYTLSSNYDSAYVRRSPAYFGVNRLIINGREAKTEEGIVWIFSPYAPPIKWSTDSSVLYFLSTATGWSKIWSINADSGEEKQITSGEGDDRDINILKDGSLIYVSNRTLRVEWSLYLKKPEAEPIKIFGEKGFVQGVSLSPDEKYVSFLYSKPSKPFDIYILEIASGKAVQVTRNTPENWENNFITPEVVTINSENRVIEGLLYLPHTGQNKYPAIIQLHGGPTMHDGLMWSELTQYLVKNRFAVLRVNYTGSAGYGKVFEELNFYRIGYEDCDDIASAARFLSTLPYIKRNCTGVTGSSYGGYLTNLVIGRYPDLFKSAVSWFGITDWNTIFDFQELHPVVRYFFKNRMGEPENYKELYDSASPVSYTDAIKTPLLLVHGGEDIVVPFEQSERFFNKLKSNGKKTELIRYDKQGHGWSDKNTRADAYKSLYIWMGKHMCDLIRINLLTIT